MLHVHAFTVVRPFASAAVDVCHKGIDIDVLVEIFDKPTHTSRRSVIKTWPRQGLFALIITIL